MSANERNVLIVSNMGLVGQVLRNDVHDIHGIGIYTYEDLFQIGCIGLCHAADTYRPGKGQFSTYAYILIRNEIFDALDYASVRRRKEDLMDNLELSECAESEMIDDPAYNINHVLAAAQAGARGVTAKGITALHLLAEGYTHREIGQRMGGVDANNVTAWVARARKYLRANPLIESIGAIR